MVSAFYDEERVSERISAFGTEVILRRFLNEVVLDGHSKRYNLHLVQLAMRRTKGRGSL